MLAPTPNLRQTPPWREQLMPRIFISYRRDDTGPYAGRLFDDLGDRFDRDALVMDIDSIEPGANFVDFIREAVDSCDVLLALIGKRWLTVRDAKRRRRLDDPDDFVRLEIGTALARNVRVIPVLLGGARMPAAARLPADLQPLSQRQAIEISDGRWDYDVGRLVASLEETVGRARGPLSETLPPSRRGVSQSRAGILAGFALAFAVLATTILAWTYLRPTDPDTPTRAGTLAIEPAANSSPLPPASSPDPSGTSGGVARSTPIPPVLGSPVAGPAPSTTAMVSPASSPPAGVAASAPKCSAGLVPDGALTYDPDTSTQLQTRNWTSSGAATLWALRSVGCTIPVEDLYDLLVPRYMTEQLGLLDTSYAGVAQALRGLGLRANNHAPISFDDVSRLAGRQPVVIGGARWAHHAGVRRTGPSGELVLANPGGTGPRFGQQTLNREQFETLGPFSALWIEMPPPPTPTPTGSRRF